MLLPSSLKSKNCQPQTSMPSEEPFVITEHIVPCSHIREYPRATASAGERPLDLCVKQYTPKSNPNPQPDDVTIIATHGSGLPKETYEPLWETILALSQKHNFRIRNIWIADASHQGASGVRNEENLGNDPSWFDHVRDLLNMVKYFRKDMPRPLVGMGHSMGASQLALLSLFHPRLFTSLVLYEPVMEQCIHAAQGPTLTKLSTARCDLWDNREHAIATARETRKDWDPRALDQWCKYAYRELPTVVYPQKWEECPEKAVTLTTTKHQEVMSYLRPNFQGNMASRSDDPKTNNIDRLSHPDLAGPSETIKPFYRAEPVMAWTMLKHVRPSVLYVFGETSLVSTPTQRQKKMERTGTGIGGSGGAQEGRVKEIVIQKSGHLVPLEKVDACAEAAVPWLEAELQLWRKNEEKTKNGWEGKDLMEKQTVSQEWLFHLKAKI